MSDKQNNTSSQQMLQQKRASNAWNNVLQLERSGYEGKYGTLVKKLPAMILSDGLGQTLAFLRAKGKMDSNESERELKDEAKAHRAAYRHVSNWVCGQVGAGQNADLLKWILEHASSDYRRAATESLAYLHWLKRFVEAKGWKSDED